MNILTELNEILGATIIISLLAIHSAQFSYTMSIFVRSKQTQQEPDKTPTVSVSPNSH